MQPGAEFCTRVCAVTFTVRFVIFSASSQTSNNTSAGSATPTSGDTCESLHRRRELYYYEGVNLKEIGRILGITESGVCQIHSNAGRTWARLDCASRCGTERPFRWKYLSVAAASEGTGMLRTTGNRLRESPPRAWWENGGQELRESRSEGFDDHSDVLDESVAASWLA